MSVNYGIPLKSQFADEEFQLTLRFLIFAAKIRYVLILHPFSHNGHYVDTDCYWEGLISINLNLSTNTFQGKTVVITGSQIPCFETRSDGRDNIINALIFSGRADHVFNMPVF